MKKIVLVVSMVFVALTMTLVACNKEEQIFSCDPYIQKYVTENLEVNQDITRDSLANLPFEYQTVVFRSLTSENKLRIFKEKIDLVLNLVSDFSDEDRDALLLLRNEAPESIYEDSEEYEVHPFVQNWESMVRSELGWTDTAIEIYVSTWNTPSELRNKAYSPSQVGVGTACGCRSFWGCAGFGSCNWDSGCTSTNQGCGIWGGAKCQGSCPEDVQPGGASSQIALSSRYEF